MNSDTAASATRSTLQTVLKWVGAVTAVLSLIFGVQQFVQVISADNARERQIAELREVGRMQRDAGDYAAAWDSFESASKLAEAGGTLAKLLGRVDARTQELRALREDLAMDWLRNIRVTAGQTFSTIIAKLLPALDQGAAAAQSTRKADLLAHIGWAYFLRSRDGEVSLNPQQRYEDSLQIDPSNPYAHAFLGHWLLWRGGTMEAAQQHFTSALATGRDQAFVRTLQLAAFRNRGSGGEAAYVATVGEMIKNHENVDADTRRAVLTTILRSCARPSGDEQLEALKLVVPGAQLRSIYDALIALDPERKRIGGPAEHDACLARLQ